MNRFFSALLLTTLLPFQGFAEDTDQQVESRQRGLELAGAFSNEGYKIRDGYWVGKVEKGKDVLIQVNLYSGNSYWFVAAASDEKYKLAVTLFDEQGNELSGERYTESGRAAAGISADTSGPFYVRIQLLEGDPAEVCLLYCYK